MGRRRTGGLIWLCAVALLAGLLAVIPSAAADEITVYQIALNDRLKPISSEFTPIVSGGSYYIPYTIFDKSVTEVNLGISYGQVKRDEVHTLTLYSMNNILVFDVLAGTCLNNKDESVDMKAIVKNGRVYVPLNVYQYFSGLQCSFTPTLYGTLIRITNGAEVLNTRQFVDAATGQMRGQYNKYLESLNIQPPVVTPTPSATPGVTPVQPDTPEDPNRQEVRVYLAFRCEGGGGLDDILTRLESSGVRALFFLRPEDVAQNADRVRRMIGGGHSVGLLVDGTDEAGLTESLRQGNDLLARVGRLRTHVVLADGAPAAAVQSLKAAGWTVWSGNVNGVAGGRSQTALSRAVLDGVAAKRSVAWVTMDDSAAAAGALGRILTQMRADGYNLRLPVETELVGA